MKLNPSHWLGGIKIGPRLMLSYTLILALMIATLSFSAFTMYRANKHVTEVFENNYRNTVALDNIIISMQSIQRIVRSIMLMGDKDPAAVARERAKIDKMRELYKTSYAVSEALSTDEKSKALLAEVNKARDKAVTINDQVNSLADQGKREEAIRLLLSEGVEALNARQVTLDNYKAYLNEQSKAAEVESTKQFSSAITISVTVSVLALLLGGYLAVLITRSITTPLDTFQKAINDVRQGANLGALAMIESKDEMSDMGFAVNQLLQDQVSARERAEQDRIKSDQEKRRAEAENEALNNSVIAILEAVNQLSQKDLTARAPVSQNIIGTVSDSINQLTEETSKVLHEVNKIAAQVAQVSSKVRSQGELVSLTAADERQNVNEMIRSLGEATMSMNQVAELAGQSNRSAERATQVTETALDTVTSTVKGMESIRETISETEKRIKRLGERSQEISGIVNLINTIAERTHVLALNASMQAAVAGEAGRGFAVVAEEVQRLAESSRNATQQIATLVNNIQLETNETISTVNRTIGQVVQGSEQAQKAGEQMRLTQEITGELVDQVRRITQASEQQKEMSAQLLGAVQRLGQSNEHTAKQIETQSKETQTLLDSAKQLVESVNVFKLPKFA
jgi:methyl-accepting chemotaxis protein